MVQDTTSKSPDHDLIFSILLPFFFYLFVYRHLSCLLSHRLYDREFKPCSSSFLVCYHSKSLRKETSFTLIYSQISLTQFFFLFLLFFLVTPHVRSDDSNQRSQVVKKFKYVCDIFSYRSYVWFWDKVHVRGFIIYRLKSSLVWDYTFPLRLLLGVNKEKEGYRYV